MVVDRHGAHDVGGGELPDARRRSARSAQRSRAAARARTLEAYRAWASARARSPRRYTADASWRPRAPLRARAFERLALPGFGRGPRYELLVLLGTLGVSDLSPSSLHLGDPLDPTTVAAKRVFGIGDAMNLRRRASELAAAAGVPIEALDLALVNWSRPEEDRITAGARDVDDGARDAAGAPAAARRVRGRLTPGRSRRSATERADRAARLDVEAGGVAGSSTWMRSSVLWMPDAAMSYGVWRIGQKP